MPNDFFSTIGFHVQDLIAGFAGGAVNAFVFKRSKPWAIIGSVMVGGFTANYLSNPIATFLGTSNNASAFIVGLGGMAICQGIIESASSWTPFKGKNHD